MCGKVTLFVLCPPSSEHNLCAFIDYEMKQKIIKQGSNDYFVFKKIHLKRNKKYLKNYKLLFFEIIRLPQVTS
jgi:hypothetical protein